MNGHTMEKPRILIVDDNQMLTDMWRTMFERVGGYEIGTENDGEAALETARIFRPNLIFMDVCMPGRNRREIVAELEADPVLKYTPVVFLTGLGREETAGHTVSGRHIVLTKPAGLPEILACAERFFPKTIPKAA